MYKSKKKIHNNYEGDKVEQKKYKEIVKKHTPKEDTIKNGFVAFISGGIMGIIGQGLITFYERMLNVTATEATSFMIITLIFLGCLFTCLGFFDNWVNFCKAGLFVPITGFAHAMMSAALDYKKEGMVTGIGSSMLKLTGSVIIFGVVSAYVFGMLRYLLFGGNI